MAFSANQSINVEPFFDAVVVSTTNYASLDNLSHYAISVFDDLQTGDIFEVQTPSNESNAVNIDSAGMVTGTNGDNFKYTLIDGQTFQRVHAQGFEPSGVVGSPPNLDTTPPVLTLIGAATVQVSFGSVYNDQGASASDNIDGDISGNISVGGSVNTNAVGQYILTYNVVDSAGNAATQVTRTVNVVDDESPIITLLGGAIVDITEGDTFIDPGATALDNVDGNITDDIAVGGDTVNVGVVGQYTLTYDVDDAAGNSAVQVTRTVNVNAAPDITAPVLAIIGPATMTHIQGQAFTDPGASWNDDFDGSGVVSAASPLDVNTLGAQVLTYSYTDAAGNVSNQVARTVTVEVGVTAPTLNTGNPVPSAINLATGTPYDLNQHITNPDNVALVFTPDKAIPAGITFVSGVLTKTTSSAISLEDVTFTVNVA